MPSGGCRARSLDLPDQGIPRQRRREVPGQLYRRMGADAHNQQMIPDVLSLIFVDSGKLFARFANGCSSCSTPRA